MRFPTSKKIPGGTILIFLIAIFISCSKKDNSNPKPQDINPTITSLSVNSGAYNTSVIITGTNFSSTISDDLVSFNGKTATVTAATATTLTVTVPLGAGTGNVSLSVKNGTRITGPVFTYQATLIASVFAGDGLNEQGYSDGVGTSAKFKYPFGLAFDSKGNLFVADRGNGLIRKITPDGTVSTFAKVGGNPTFIVFDGAGNLYCTVFDLGTVIKITPTGLISTFASGFSLPFGIAIDGLGNLYVADQENNIIKKITPAGVVTILAGKVLSDFPTGPPINGPGNLATFFFPTGIIVDAAGNVYVADVGDSMIRKITPDGIVSTFAGNYTSGSADGNGATAGFFFPTGLAIDKTGNIYVADQNNQTIRKITPEGTVSTIAGVKGDYGPTKSGPATSIVFDYPVGVAVDATGNIYVSGASVISKLSFE